jgi:hypothetical protein
MHEKMLPYLWSLGRGKSKLTLRFYLTPLRMAIIKKPKAANEPYTLLVGMYINIATMEISIEVLQKTKNRTTI